MHPEYIMWKLGESVQHRALDALAVAPAGATQILPVIPAKTSWPWILVLGAVHGDELEGVWLCEEMRSRWTKHFPYMRLGVVVWAQVNPDGVALGQRWNAHNVDLNRNLPSKDWIPEIKNPRYPPGSNPGSEPETRTLVTLIETLKPTAILSVHSFGKAQVNANGPAIAWAEKLAKSCGYPVTQDVGYPTPGSLGTYAGAERGIPTITLEIERGIAKVDVLAAHVPVLEAALRYWEER